MEGGEGSFGAEAWTATPSLVLDRDTLTATTDPDQQLVIWTAEPGSATEEGLRFLAS
ncbi:hypothetical protein [Streptomyces sp. NPDC058374]|uniref:hypothetical protein n=1 Tax=Streptomyces sp. NPDC058374 TaxID=3346466 RepID=UPI00364CF389